MHVSVGRAPKRSGDLAPTDSEQTQFAASERDLEILRIVGHGEQVGLVLDPNPVPGGILCTARTSVFLWMAGSAPVCGRAGTRHAVGVVCRSPQTARENGSDRGGWVAIGSPACLVERSRGSLLP